MSSTKESRKTTRLQKPQTLKSRSYRHVDQDQDRARHGAVCRHEFCRAGAGIRPEPRQSLSVLRRAQFAWLRCGLKHADANAASAARLAPVGARATAPGA